MKKVDGMNGLLSAMEIHKRMMDMNLDEHDMEVVLYVNPQWDNNYFDGFSINGVVTESVEQMQDVVLFKEVEEFNTHNATINDLVCMLYELQRVHGDCYTVSVFATYNGCNELITLYNDLMSNLLDVENGFCMEYEWG